MDGIILPPYCVLSAEHLTIDPELKELELLWQRLWVTQEDPFGKWDVLRDANRAVDVDFTATFRVLYGLPRYGDVLVREEYEEALEVIKGYEITQNRVVVVGHPGIGMDLASLTHLLKAIIFREGHFLVLPTGSPLVASPANSFPVRK